MDHSELDSGDSYPQVRPLLDIVDKNWVKSALIKQQGLRDDYRELLELTVIFLGQVPPRGASFLAPRSHAPRKVDVESHPHTEGVDANTSSQRGRRRPAAIGRLHQSPVHESRRCPSTQPATSEGFDDLHGRRRQPGPEQGSSDQAVRAPVVPLG